VESEANGDGHGRVVSGPGLVDRVAEVVFMGHGVQHDLGVDRRRDHLQHRIEVGAGPLPQVREFAE